LIPGIDASIEENVDNSLGTFRGLSKEGMLDLVDVKPRNKILDRCNAHSDNVINMRVVR